MPLIKIQTSVTSLDDETINQLLQSLSAKLAKHLGKPESYVMTALESGIKMTFAGTCDFCQEIEAYLGIPKNRIYLEFAEAKGDLWGWNGTTFG